MASASSSLVHYRGREVLNSIPAPPASIAREIRWRTPNNVSSGPRPPVAVNGVRAARYAALRLRGRPSYRGARVPAPHSTPTSPHGRLAQDGSPEVRVVAMEGTECDVGRPAPRPGRRLCGGDARCVAGPSRVAAGFGMLNRYRTSGRSLRIPPRTPPTAPSLRGGPNGVGGNLIPGVTRYCGMCVAQRVEAQAAEQLPPLVYDELRRLAAQSLSQEKPGQTLFSSRHLCTRRTSGW